MSFSQKVKNELARVQPEKACCQLAELAALIRMDGSMQISSDHQTALVISTENAAVARKVFRLGKGLFSLEAEIGVTRQKRLRKNNIYTIRILPQAGIEHATNQLGIKVTPSGYHLINEQALVAKRCCQRAYLRGAFLGGGSVNNPEQRTYHMEIITQDPYHKGLICQVIRKFGLLPKVSTRKKWYVIYLKDSQQIVDFLNVVGAHAALLKFEDVKVYKDMRNRVNRLVNCETANLNKTVEAGIRQVENIRRLQARIGLDNIPPNLREVAKLRLEYPDASLKELGEMLNPPVTKSGINHRLRRLERLAEKLEE